METASRVIPAHGAPTIHLRGTASTWNTHIFADPFVVADPTRRAVKPTKRMVHFIVQVTTRIVHKARTALACTRFAMPTWADALVVNVHFARTAVLPTIAPIKGMARELVMIMQLSPRMSRQFWVEGSFSFESDQVAQADAP